MMIPQPTEQYGQVLRVSLVCSSLNVRTSASASRAENPRAVRLETPTAEAESFTKLRLVTSM